MPRFQVGFPPQHLLLTLLGDYWSGRSRAAAVCRARRSARRVRRQSVGSQGRAQPTVDPRSAGRHQGWSQHLLSSRRRVPAPAAVRPDPHARVRQAEAASGTAMWTMVAFTVPEDQRRLRPMLRGRLQSLGFAPLYDGLWVSPHAPDKELDIALEIAPPLSCTVDPGHRTADRQPAWRWRRRGTSTTSASRTPSSSSTFRPVLRRLEAGRIGPTEALVSRHGSTYRWFVFAVTDPDLPKALLPEALAAGCGTRSVRRVGRRIGGAGRRAGPRDRLEI